MSATNGSLRLLAALMLAVLTLAACKTIGPGMEAWEGHNIQDLVRSWGQPDSITPLGNGIEAYTWVMDEDDCQHSFTIRDQKIMGTSDTDCSG